MPALPKHMNRLVGRAMHTYAMLADGDRVLIAVSGGIDSLVLTWLLDHWRKKAPIGYELLAVHLDMGFGGNSHLLVEGELGRLNVPFHIEQTTYGIDALKEEDGKSGCYHCAKQRRNRLFELARERRCNKIAFGHHQEDIIETFFLNMFYSGNMSTMVPRQDLFDGRLALIRPLALLEKRDIKELGAALAISPVDNPCPLTERSKRAELRALLGSLYAQDSKIKANIFSALANIKLDYLLLPPDGKPGVANADHP